ncbi:MAG: DNA replication/repair protein RecF [Candidatus Margulisbacteria bacterium]|nr:DNA replication/repair protein RecF [Candidatus Margulisiibacteriota bacterium]
MLKKLWIKGFRNFDEVNLDFSSSLKWFFFGDNNQGKSNLLESIYFLTTGKSPREEVLKNLIGFHKSEALLGADFESDSGLHRVYLKLSSDGVRQSMVNNVVVRSFTQLSKLICVSYVSADLIRVFQDSPEGRRHFLDGFCALYFSEYGSLLKKYKRVISQKNRLLKTCPELESFLVWNRQLCLLSKTVYEFRIEALNVLSDVVNGLAFNFVSGSVSLKYVIRGYDNEYMSSEGYFDWLLEKVNDSFVKERTLGYSLYGAHRDDFYIEIDGKKLMTFFSRGINRVMSILIYVSELIILNKKGSLFPILLLDDALAELDFKIKEGLLKLMGNYTQLFYASVLEEDKNIFGEGCIVRIDSGEIQFA